MWHLPPLLWVANLVQYQSLLFSKFEQISANVVFATLLLYFGYPRKSIFSSSATYTKMVLTWCALCILTSKSASRHNGVHFFDISTSKNGPDLVCFVHFDFEMRFAPQRRALFRHLNFQKWSEPGVSYAFWLRNVLRATTACNFSSLIGPDGSAPAALASLLFDPLEPQIIGKTQCFATFLPFRGPASSFFWLFLFSDFLSSTLLLFYLLLFSSLCLFPSLLFICPYCRNFDF